MRAVDLIGGSGRGSSNPDVPCDQGLRHKCCDGGFQELKSADWKGSAAQSQYIRREVDYARRVKLCRDARDAGF